MQNGLEKTLEEIKETAKGSEKDRLNRLEFGMQEVKSRLSGIESYLGIGEVKPHD